MLVLLVIALALLFLFPLFWSAYERQILSYFSRIRKANAERFKGRPADLVRICAKFIYDSSIDQLATVYEYVTRELCLYPFYSDLMRVFVISVGYSLCSYLNDAVSPNFAVSVMGNILDLLHDDMFGPSDYSGNFQNYQDFLFVNALEKSVSGICDESTDQYYAKLVTFVLINSHSVRKTEDIPQSVSVDLGSRIHAWTDSSITSLSELYDSVRPLIKRGNYDTFKFRHLG